MKILADLTRAIKSETPALVKITRSWFASKSIKVSMVIN